ncbi:hypothetical protein ACLOJK_033393 [Asimina triloba]
MARKYGVLQKKIEELESILTKVFNDSMETTFPYNHLLSEAIDGKILFLRNLLSAETGSHPHNPHHLNHITQRLDLLETAFHEWNESRSLPIDIFPTTTTTTTTTPRACSCTSSCVNDNENETIDPDSPLHNQEEEEEPIFPFQFTDGTSLEIPETVEDMPPATATATATVAAPNKEEEEERDEKWWRFWVVAAALAVAMGVATASLMRRGGFYQQPDNVSLIPT